MDKRTSGRIILSLQAELIADSKSYSGIIENLSEAVHVLKRQLQEAN